MEDVVGPFFVGGGDVKFPAELGGFEVNVVFAEKFGDFIKKAFGPEEEGFEGKVTEEDDGGKFMAGMSGLALGVMVFGFIMVIEGKKFPALPVTFNGISGVPVFTLLQEFERGEPGVQSILLGGIEGQVFELGPVEYFQSALRFGVPLID
jgi:hypothetical protein